MCRLPGYTRYILLLLGDEVLLFGTQVLHKGKVSTWSCPGLVNAKMSPSNLIEKVSEHWGIQSNADQQKEVQASHVGRNKHRIHPEWERAELQLSFKIHLNPFRTPCFEKLEQNQKQAEVSRYSETNFKLSWVL